LKILIALIMFSAIVLFHELGHFLLAKKNHIVVTEFSLGMGPRLLSTVKGETRYSLKLLPFGGSCAMLGEDLEDTQPGSFLSAPVWGRISVVAAGPIFNFILAFILAMIIVALSGSNITKILEVTEGSPAWEAGLREGDIVTSYQGYHVDLWEDYYVYWYLNSTEGETIRLKVERDGKPLEIVYEPEQASRYLLGMYRNSGSMEVTGLMEGMPLADAGVQVGDVITSINGTAIGSEEDYNRYIEENPLTKEPVTIEYVRDGLTYEAEIVPAESTYYISSYSCGAENVKASGFSLLKYSFLEVKSQIRTTIQSLKGLLTGGLGVKDMSGPVGVVDAIGTTYEESKDEGAAVLWSNLLYMAVLLSANLGVMNLLPLPALDGGRLLFLLIEAIRRKPGNRQLEGAIHFAGMMLLMALMLFIMYNDILKLV